MQPYQYNYVHNTNNTLGATVLQNRAIHQANWWIWLGVGVMAAYVILFNVGVSLALAYLPRKHSMTVQEVLLFARSMDDAKSGRRQYGN